MSKKSPKIVHLFMACALGIGVASTAFAQLPTAELQSLSRQVFQSGATGDVTLQGNRLDELTHLVAHDMNGSKVNISATVRPAPIQPLRDDRQTTTIFDIAPEASVPDGIIEVRSAGRFGISNPRAVLISTMPVDVPSTGHNNLVAAHSIKPNHLINDKINDKASNYYRCDVKSGQHLRCVAYCKQLDSLAELNLRLLNGDGQLISSSRSIGRWPAELGWTNTTGESQAIYIEVRDLLYRGGPNFNFVMEVRTGDVAGAAEVQPLYLDARLRPRLELPLKVERLSQPVGAAYVHRGWNEATSLPSNPIEKFPIRIQGDLLRPQVITFVAEKGQALSFEIASASLDQLTDPAFIIYKVSPATPDGKSELQQVAEQDDAAYLGTPAVRVRRMDPQLVWSAPETSSYQLHVVDRQTGERPKDSRRFLLEIRPTQPSFSLIAHEPFPVINVATSKPWGSLLARNGTMQVSVSVLRYDGFAGPIELSVEGLPPHCICPPVVVPGGAVEADLIIQAVGDIDNSLSSLSIVGTAKRGEETITARALGATISSAVIPTRNAVASRFAGSISAQLVNVDTAPLQLRLGDGNPLEVKAGTKFNLPVKLIRQAGSAAECTLRPKALPDKVGLGEFKVAGDKAEASPEVNVPADAPVGEHTFWVQAETKVKWRANPQELAREEAYAAKLKSTLESNSTGDVPRPQVEAALKQANNRVEELKKSTAEQEYTVVVPSNPIRIRILPKE